MLKDFSKIVVIGSNTTKRTGPRVGSIGYIQHHMSSFHDYQFEADYVANIIYMVNCLFIRYGYQEKDRLENKKVCILAPALRSNGSPRKALNKLISEMPKMKSEPISNIITVAPLIDKVETLQEKAINLALMSATSSVSMFTHNYRSAVNGLLKGSKNYPEDKYLAIKDSVGEFGHRILICMSSNVYSNISIILANLREDPEVYDKIKAVLVFAEVMSREDKKMANKKRGKFVMPRPYRNNVRVGANRPLNRYYESSDIKSLFSDWNTNNFNGRFYDSLKSLRKEIVNRGTIIANK